MSLSRFHLASCALGAAFLVFASWLVTGWRGPSAVIMVSDVGALLASGFAVTCVGFAARRSTHRQRWAWSAMTVGLTGWLFGDAVWAYFDLLAATDTTPFPSIADAGYLLFSAATCMALVLLPIGAAGQSQIRILLDGLIVAASLFVIFWASGLDEALAARDEGQFAFAVSLAYPISDLVLLTVALVVMTRARTGQRAMMACLTAAIAAMTVSDGFFVVLSADDEYSSGNLIDIGWVAGLLLIGVAAIMAVRSGNIAFGPTRAPSGTALWLPYLLLPLATACMVNGDKSTPLLVAAMVLVLAAMARQFIVVTENRRLLSQVAEQILRDPLTGLANRALFRDRLNHAMALKNRDGRRVAVLSVDLDDFKLVNDSMGHPAGDELLKAVAARLLTNVRDGDTVARVGGDEFAILVEGGVDPPLTVAHRMADSFEAPFTIEGHDVFTRASVGVAMAAAGVDPEPDVAAEILLKHADLAMYAAKRSEDGGVHHFTEDMHLIDVGEVDPTHDRDNRPGRQTAGLHLFGQLRRAIDRDELSLVYQPKFATASGQVAGVEALVRWEHPQRGLMLPSEFLPLARRNGLMGALTEAVLRRAVSDATLWRGHGRDVPLAVNLFPPSLGDPELPGRILRILTDGGLAPENLTVEVTEDFVLGNMDRARDVLNLMREKHIRVSIDDFGSGYSALSYLRDLPIDEIKLDRAFIEPILRDCRAEAIVCAIIDLAHRLEMTCVAEGVESAETADRLGAHACDVIQGFYCGPPVDAAAVPGLRPLVATSGDT